MSNVDRLLTESDDPHLKAVLALCRSLVPGFEVVFKDESALMKFLNFFAQLFNKKFMTHYTTTIDRTVYFPSRANVMMQQSMYAEILAHELVHMTDRQREGALPYFFRYAFPQVLSVLSLLSVLAFWNPWFLLCLLFLVFLAPLPSPGRRDIELDGYEMSLAVIYWRQGELGDGYFEWIADKFVSSDYYFMWPWGAEIVHELKLRAQRFRTGEVLKRAIYRQVHAIFAKK